MLYDDAVRRQIRSETGLRLSDANLKNNVPVRVEPLPNCCGSLRRELYRVTYC